MRLPRILATVLVAAMTLAATPSLADADATGPKSSGSSPTSAEQRTKLELAAEAYALKAHNDQRRAGRTRKGATYSDVSGTARMTGYTDMMTVSRAWSDRIHLDNFKHNPKFGSQYGYWSSTAENIAVRTIKPASHGTPSKGEVVSAMEKLMQGWWKSTGHRKNWMNPRWDHFSVGVSVKKLKQSFSGSSYWVISATANFRDSKGSVASRWHGVSTDGSTPPNEIQGRFVDVPRSHTHYRSIDALAASGITKGCDEFEFCPGEYVTRGQMAAFLDRALGLPDSKATFADTRGHTFERSIAALARADITVGCAPNRFCPNRPVTRGQMAAFLDRALNLPNRNASFVDTRGHTFESNVGDLAGANITRGCNAPSFTRFCPNDYVTRAQMATFLHSAGLTK